MQSKPLLRGVIVLEANSLSEISSEVDDTFGGHNNYDVEITHEDFLVQQTAAPNRVSPSRASPHRSVATRISNLMMYRGRSNTNSSNNKSDSISVSSENSTSPHQRRSGTRSNGRDNHSENGDNLGSQQSVGTTTITVASHETVKVSNKSEKPGHTKKRKGWSKLRKIMGVKTSSSETNKVDHYRDSLPTIPQSRSLDAPSVSSPSSPALMRRLPMGAFGGGSTSTPDRKVSRRTRSTPDGANQHRQEMMDQCIRGRLDGVELLVLAGRAQYCQNNHSTNKNKTLDQGYLSLPRESFTGMPVAPLTPAQMTAHMLWNSAGKRPPEIVLEGFLPGSDDRWIVQIEKQPHISMLPGLIDPTLRNKVEGTDDGGSPHLPIHQLWSTLWGPEPPPVSLTNLGNYENKDEDPVMLLAAECSVPIDLDEDTFIISNRDHLRVIHEIASGPLTEGQFDLTLSIFKKLLHAVDLSDQDDLKFLKGTTYHNIGMLQMWQGLYADALYSFDHAVEERVQHLPKDHPDIVVSLLRKGLAYFALDQIDEAIAVLESTLSMIPSDHIIRAKVLNNLGVAYFHQKDYSGALNLFTKSLDIHRKWLEGSVQREPLVHDAAVTMCNIGQLHWERGNYEPSADILEEAVLLQTSIFRKDHYIVLETITNLAVTRAQKGLTNKALQILSGCQRSKNMCYGSSSATSIETTGLMGYLYVHAKEYEEAMKCFGVVKKWQKANLPADHPTHQQTMKLIDAIEQPLAKDVSVWI